MRALIRGCELFYDIDGAALVPEEGRMRERPTAFLIHGGPGSDHTGYKTRYNDLRERMQLVYIDQRGQGRSAGAKPETCNLDENVEDMEALRRYLGLERIVVVGGSYGGMVALAYASRYPSAVSHLVVFATVAHAGYVQRAREIVSERGTELQISMCEDLFAGRVDSREKMIRYFEVMGPLYTRRAFDWNTFKRGLERSILSPQAQNSAHGPDGFLRKLDLRPELHSVTAPTLVLGGRYDWICAPEFSLEIGRYIKHADCRILEESSHFLALDEPQPFFDTVFGFLTYNPLSVSR